MTTNEIIDATIIHCSKSITKGAMYKDIIGQVFIGEKSHTEIGKKYGISAIRVRQINDRFWANLRRNYRQLDKEFNTERMVG